MNKNRLIYLPLGGAGEVGMNCYVYGYGPKNNERLIVVDLGVAFPDMDSSPGCLLYTSPSPRDGLLSRMPSSA